MLCWMIGVGLLVLALSSLIVLVVLLFDSKVVSYVLSQGGEEATMAAFSLLFFVKEINLQPAV